MSETWLPFCIRRPGPPEKQGYHGIPSRPLSAIRAEVKHSMDGYAHVALQMLMNPSLRKSWHFSVPFLGPPLQHYPLEAVTWHCGTLEGNVSTIGIEHEGLGAPITHSQVQWTVELSRAFMRLCPQMAKPERHKTLLEHNEIVPTACPSGRIPWDRIIAALVTPQEEDDLMILVKPQGRPEHYTLEGVHITSPEELEALVAAAGGKVTVKELPRTDRFWTTRPFWFPNGLPQRYLE